MGEKLSIIWAIPFAGMLLSIALGPLLAPHFWHHHYRKLSLAWAVVFALPFWLVYRADATHEILHILLLDYVPFVILLGTLYTVSGGILLRGNLRGTPLVNTSILTVGTAMASFIGTTGASMILIRPLLRANNSRQYRVHTIVFFIFLVSNMGGLLTPLGDPPLFLGFLHHVPFFWTLTHLWPHFLVGCGILLAVFFLMDLYLFSRESAETRETLGATSHHPLELDGKVNLIFLPIVLLAVLISGYWKAQYDWGAVGWDGNPIALSASADSHESEPEASAHAHDKNHQESTSADHHSGQQHHRGVLAGISNGQLILWDVGIPIQNVARDVILVLVLGLSLLCTPRATRQENQFTWAPMIEVAALFFGIFVTIVPLLQMLEAGRHGAMAPIVAMVKEPRDYFLITGILSSFLDNAPTYITFFQTALGQFHAEELARSGEAHAVALFIAQQPNYLAAISVGAVFMGANTYIGNAPNFMVRAMAEEFGVKMPDFFSYILKYTIPFLVPTFAIVTYVFFR